MQRRIDEATAARKTAETEVARLKAQLEADPDKKLTPEEVETRAEAIAAKKVADKELADVQAKFEAACDKLQKGALTNSILSLTITLMIWLSSLVLSHHS